MQAPANWHSKLLPKKNVMPTSTASASPKVPSLINTYEVTVTANPAEGGTVTGGGTYNDGTTTTLTATASTATGYSFSNWTKAGAVVSTNATYTVTVTEAGEYVANFTLNTQTLTVHYQYEDGVAVGDDTVKQVNIGSTYNVVSPVMDCYVADKVRKKTKKRKGEYLLLPNYEYICSQFVDIPLTVTTTIEHRALKIKHDAQHDTR